MFTVAMGIGEAGYYTRESGPSGDDLHRASRHPRGTAAHRCRPHNALAVEAWGDTIRRYGRRVLLAVAAVLGIYFVLFPLAASLRVHACRAGVCARARARYRVRGRALSTTTDGLRLGVGMCHPRTAQPSSRSPVARVR